MYDISRDNYHVCMTMIWSDKLSDQRIRGNLKDLLVWWAMRVTMMSVMCKMEDH